MYTPVKDRMKNVLNPKTTGYIPVAQRQKTTPQTTPQPLVDFGLGMNTGIQTSTPQTTQGSFITPGDVAVKKIAVDVGQSVARNIASAGLSVSGKIQSATGGKDTVAEPMKEDDFKSIYAQSLFSTVFGKGKEIKPVETMIAEKTPKVKDWGEEINRILVETPNLSNTEKVVLNTLGDLAKYHPESLTFLGVIGSVGLDLTPFGGGEKGVFKAMVGAKDVAEASKVLMKIGVADDLIEQFAKDVVKVSDEKTAKKLIESIANLQQTTKAVAPKAYTPVAERLKPTTQPTLIQEAKKAIAEGKSADEFIKAQEVLYHGGSKIDSVKLGKSNFGRTFYLSDNSTYAKSFGGNKSVLNEFVLDKSANLVDMRKPSADLVSKIESRLNRDNAVFSDSAIVQGIKDGKAHFAELPEVKVILKKLGYDGQITSEVPFAKNIGVWNKDIIKTKSQLKEIYNKAKGVSKTPEGLPKLPKITTKKVRSMQEQANEEFTEILNGTFIEMTEFSKPGYRYQGGGVGSTFPKWTSDKLKSTKLFNTVVNKLENGIALKGSNQIQLKEELYRHVYNLMTPELALEKQLSDLSIELYKKGEILSKERIAKIKKEIEIIKDKKKNVPVKVSKSKVNEFIGKEKPKAITRPEDVLLRERLRAEARGAKTGVKSAKETIKERRMRIRAVQNTFQLTDKEMAKIRRGRDITAMDNTTFDDYIFELENKGAKEFKRSEALMNLKTTIYEKELDVENLRKAMKLPTMKNMTIKDIKNLDEALQPFQKGDEFLSVRKLEVVDRTELKGIKTWREAREKLAKKLGVPIEELQNIKVSEFDRFRYDTALAEKNPFYGMMVEETAKKVLVSEAEYLKVEKEILKIAKGLKPKGIDRLIPQQKNIRKFMETPIEKRAGIKLTETEQKLVKVMTEEFDKARDYLIQMEAMKMGKENYFTHIRRGILEAVKEDGVIKAVKEVFTQYKLEEQAFNILDKQTGDILAMDKFFRFAMHRTGEIIPTENTVGAFLKYMKTFKKKQALDEIVPLVDIYAQSLTPKGLTKKGVLLHGDLQRFVKEFLNTKKGRHITLVAKQNGKIDGALRAIKMFTSLRDLGINLPVSIASEIGEQVTTYQLLGKGKFALGKIRQNTKQGKAIIEKYRNLIGKNPWKELFEPAKEAGDRLMEGIFIMFRDATTRANKTFLLGSLTKEEMKTGIISPERLSSLRTELGRYRMVEGMKSIIGATPEGGSYTQYKSWAIPILRTTTKNLADIGKKLTGLSKGSKEWKKASIELYRLAEVTAFTMLAFSMVRDEDDKSFVGTILNKAYREATTLVQALSPKMFLTAGRTASFITDLGENLTSILLLEEYKTKEGLVGVEGLKRQLKPVAVRQLFTKEKSETKNKSFSTPAGLPKLPSLKNSLPKLPSLPKL